MSQDAAGNLIGRIPGTTAGAGTITVGSHSDTVPSGGRFDGVAGVIAALEIGRVLKESGIKFKHDIELVDFLAEEPNVYGLSCVGSRGITGNLSAESLSFTEPGGEKLSQAIKRVGGDPEKISEAKRGDIKAFFELHIEQGPILVGGTISIGSWCQCHYRSNDSVRLGQQLLAGRLSLTSRSDVHTNCSRDSHRRHTSKECQYNSCHEQLNRIKICASDHFFGRSNIGGWF